MIPLLLIIGLMLLYWGAEWLVKGAVAIAQKARLQPLVIGLTVVAFGTSMPEMTVSVQAALNGSGDIAAANVIGSNIFNVAFILGLAAIICPIRVTLQLIRIDIPVMMGVSVICLLVLFDQYISRTEGLVLCLGILIYTGASFYIARNKPSEKANEQVQEMLGKQGNKGIYASFWTAGAVVALGLLLLVLGSKCLIAGSVQLARLFKISEAVIGLTIVSMGTSLPELATSVVAALRKQPDITAGNVIGSNIFNILGILGTSSLLRPYSTPGISLINLFAMLGIAVISLPLMRSSFTLSRVEGAIMMACYGMYVWYLWPVSG